MSIFVTKGDAPLTSAQLENRAQSYINRSWTSQAREQSIRKCDGVFDAFMLTFSNNHDVNTVNNTFNYQMGEYRKATSRLAKYILADGRPEITEQQPTGEKLYNEETGEYADVMHEVVVQTFIEALEATVEQTTYDDEGVATTATVTNPLIVTDEAEREDAQFILENTPPAVVDYQI